MGGVTSFMPALAQMGATTQWRTAGMGGVTGLDYVAVGNVMRWMGVPASRRGETFEALQVMEAAALPLINERREPQAP